MAHRFKFNRKNMDSIVVEGQRIDVRGSTLTVVDEHGQPLASFAESDIRVWWQLHDGLSASIVKAP